MKKALYSIIIICFLFVKVGYSSKSSIVSISEKNAINTPNSVKLNVVYIPQKFSRKFYGIGVAIQDNLNGFEIINLIPNGPSEKSLKIKDLIIAVDKKSIVGMNIMEVIELIKEEKSSKVKLTIIRKDKKLDVEIIKGEIASEHDGKSCAETSVAMIISYYENLNDNPIDSETAWKISGTNEYMSFNYGANMEGLKNIADHYGYKSEYIENMKISDVEYFLSKGIPVMLNIKNGKGTTTHALIVIGYDKTKKLFYTNDSGNRCNKILEYSDLETRWLAHLSSPIGMSYRSGFIVYPKNSDTIK